MVRVLITIVLTVTIFDVPKLKTANANENGGGPNHDPRITIVFDVADPRNANNHKDGACPPTIHTTGGRGKIRMT